MKRLLFLLPVLLFLAACQTGIVREVKQAFTGVPPEIPTALDSIEVEYDRLSASELADIDAGNVVDDSGAVVPDAVIKKQLLHADRQQRIDSVHALFDSLRTYLAVEKGAAPGASTEAAAKMRSDLAASIMKELDAARTKAAAKKTSKPNP
jgi:hypothetical protein